MGDILTFLVVFIGFFVLFFGNYAVFAWTVLRWTKKPIKKKVKGGFKFVQPQLTTGERVRCCIPIWQTYEVHKALSGPNIAIKITTIVSMVFIGFNLFVSFVLPINGYVMFFGHVLFYIGFLIAWILTGVITFRCAGWLELGGITRVLNLILPHIFCFYIKNNIPHIVTDLRKSKTFEESNDTIIKPKHSEQQG